MSTLNIKQANRLINKDNLKLLYRGPPEKLNLQNRQWILLINQRHKYNLVNTYPYIYNTNYFVMSFLSVFNM